MTAFTALAFYGADVRRQASFPHVLPEKKSAALETGWRNKKRSACADLLVSAEFTS
jgi:hypothetical protein